MGPGGREGAILLVDEDLGLRWARCKHGNSQSEQMTRPLEPQRVQEAKGLITADGGVPTLVIGKPGACGTRREGLMMTRRGNNLCFVLQLDNRARMIGNSRISSYAVHVESVYLASIRSVPPTPSTLPPRSHRQTAWKDDISRQLSRTTLRVDSQCSLLSAVERNSHTNRPTISSHPSHQADTTSAEYPLRQATHKNLKSTCFDFAALTMILRSLAREPGPQ